MGVHVRAETPHNIKLTVCISCCVGIECNIGFVWGVMLLWFCDYSLLI